MKEIRTVEEMEEIIRCVDANLDNLAKLVPGLSEHPFFRIAKYQIEAALGTEPEEI